MVTILLSWQESETKQKIESLKEFSWANDRCTGGGIGGGRGGGVSDDGKFLF